MASTTAAPSPTTAAPPPTSWCTRCAAYKGKTSACGKCAAAFYCSKDCQVQDWHEGYKKECKKQLLYNVEALPQSLLRVVKAERVVKWVNALKLPHHHAASDVAQRKATLLDILAVLDQDEVNMDNEFIFCLGLFPGLTHFLHGLGPDDEGTTVLAIKLVDHSAPHPHPP